MTHRESVILYKAPSSMGIKPWIDGWDVLSVGRWPGRWEGECHLQLSRPMCVSLGTLSWRKNVWIEYQKIFWLSTTKPYANLWKAAQLSSSFWDFSSWIMSAQKPIKIMMDWGSIWQDTITEVAQGYCWMLGTPLSPAVSEMDLFLWNRGDTGGGARIVGHLSSDLGKQVFAMWEEIILVF